MLKAKAGKVEQLFHEPTLEHPAFSRTKLALIAILKTYTAATQCFHGGIGVRELLLEAARANGYTGRNFRDSRAVLRFAFRWASPWRLVASRSGRWRITCCATRGTIPK